MSIQLEPSTQLGFTRPLTQLVKKSLVVRNNNSQPVAFKVKTTAPKLYCVRPNSGRIEPGQSVEVSVLLQPMREDPPPGAKCKDKFLVQSTLITPEKEGIPLSDIWNAGGEGDNAVHQQKIKVVYLQPEGEVVEEVEEPSVFSNTSHYETARAPSNGHANVRDTFPINVHPPQPGHERSPSPAQGEYIIAHEDTTQHETHYGETPGVVNINVHSPAPQPQDDGQAKQYAEAQAEIARLRQLVDNLSAVSQNQMRRRNRPASDDGTSWIEGSVDDTETVVDRAPPATESGVPLQVVIIIAIGVFVTTYLFF